MARKTGLGRGFEALIPTDLVEEAFDPTSKEDAKVSQLLELDLDDVVRDEDQPRKNFTKESLDELAASIKEHGVMSPIMVVKVGDKYQIVAGERRWRASKQAGLKKIPALVRTMDAQKKLELSLIENMQRVDLNAIEIATGYAKLKNQFNLSNEEIGKRVGKSPGSIVNTMRLLKLPEEAKRAMQEHNLMEGPMRPLISADPEMVHEILPKMIEEGWSARRVERYIADHKKKSSTSVIKNTPYVKEEAKLCKKYDTEVRIRGRSVTFSAKNDEEFRALLEKF